MITKLFSNLLLDLPLGRDSCWQRCLASWGGRGQLCHRTHHFPEKRQRRFPLTPRQRETKDKYHPGCWRESLGDPLRLVNSVGVPHQPSGHMQRVGPNILSDLTLQPFRNCLRWGPKIVPWSFKEAAGWPITTPPFPSAWGSVYRLNLRMCIFNVLIPGCEWQDELVRWWLSLSH